MNGVNDYLDDRVIQNDVKNEWKDSFGIWKEWDEDVIRDQRSLYELYLLNRSLQNYMAYIWKMQ